MERDKADGGKKALFSDIDGTLAFCEGVHELQFVQVNDDGTVEVVRTDKPKTYRGYRIPSEKRRGQGIFVDEKTKDLGHRLAEYYDWFCVTGAGYDSLRKRARVLDFSKGYVLENGGIILDGDFNEDQEWNASIARQVAHLPDITRYLQKQGWVVDPSRKASIRLRQENNPQMKNSDFAHIRSEIRRLRPVRGLKVTFNFGYLDIIPKNAGKGNAIDYIIRKNGYDPQEIVGIGDDINDLSLLEHVTEKYVVGSGHPELVQAARTGGWYVSRGSYVDGINEILKKILQTSS